MKKRKVLGVIGGISAAIVGTLAGNKIMKARDKKNQISKEEMLSKLEDRVMSKITEIIEKEEIDQGSQEANIEYVINHYNIDAIVSGM